MTELDPREEAVAKALLNYDAQQSGTSRDWDYHCTFAAQGEERSIEVMQAYLQRAQIAIKALRDEVECYRQFKQWQREQKL